MKILIDNGHGQDTPGKCSPDGLFREYRYARQIASAVVKRLCAKGLDAELLTPEQRDIPLRERCRRVNGFCMRHGASQTLLVSIHNNAAGSDGKWHEARGWQVYVSPGASENSLRLARMFTTLATTPELRGNRASQLLRGNFAILRDTKCPAVLTENLFQDNRRDVAWLNSAAGREKIINMHVEAIAAYVTG